MLAAPPPPLARKAARLREVIRSYGRVAVAFSGGVDSTLLLKIAREELGGNVLAVTARSPSYPQREMEEAERLAREMGARHLVIDTKEVRNPDYAANPANRCYYCKTELFEEMIPIAAREGIPYIAYGEIADDASDHRPGREAAIERGVRWPLREAGLSKDEVRALSRELGLPTWDKPASPCLSSRFPYGTQITPELLARVEAAEEYVRGLGIREFRVRHHDTIARLELHPEDFPRVLDPAVRDPLVSAFRKLGYLYVALDLYGFRSGSLNAALAQGSARTA